MCGFLLGHLNSYRPGFSNDPYLDGKIVFETVTGIQAEGVIATTKVVSALDPVSRIS